MSSQSDYFDTDIQPRTQPLAGGQVRSHRVAGRVQVCDFVVFDYKAL